MQSLDRQFATNVPCVQSGRGLKKQHMALLFGYWPVLDAPGHDQELAFREIDVPVAKFHAKSSGDDVEQLILVVVAMPYKFAQ